MGFYGDRVLPRLVELTCGTSAMNRPRARVAAGLKGRTVEIGFGSGFNVAHYPEAVTEVLAVEPSELARTRAAARIEASPIPVHFVGLDGQSLPIETDSCDSALATFTLCTIDDVEAALGELRRVLRPGGRFHFLEHGGAPDAGVRKWQERIDPFEMRFAGGCRLTREPDRLISDAGFEIVEIDQRYVAGPKPWSWFTSGIATNPA